MYTKGRCILSVCVLLATEHALAAGMDCTKAASAVEKTICAHTGLYGLDTQMGSAYRSLVKVQPELKTAQRAWLKIRDQCAENVECLDQHYRERLQVLQKQWSEAVIYTPDDVDSLVSEDLRQAIQKAGTVDAEFPLEKILDSLAVKTGTTDFSDVADDDNAADEYHFPKTIPAGVTPDEWKALTASKIRGEDGNSSYTLIDLDGDGLRDLVVDNYTGGTGLFSFIETFRRSGDVFVRRTLAFDSEANSDSALLSLNDRGANQSVSWIKARGRIYAAYRNSYYGVDHLYLLAPLKLNGAVPTVSVNYRYKLSIPKTQKDETSGATVSLDAARHKALTQALGSVNRTEAKDIGDQSHPLCPIPPSGEGDSTYYSYGPGHYSFEIVGDMPVMIDGQCYIGRMMDWFGGYNVEHGLHAQLLLRKPDPEVTERSYQVNGRRRMTDVMTSIDKVEGDNGN